MPRTARQLSRTQVYHVMMRGNEKKSIFLEDEDREMFIQILKAKKQENEIDLYAYCLMNNHVHLLINEKKSSIGRVMKCINTAYAMYFNKTYSRVGHLFQDRFRSEPIHDEAYLLRATRYIHRNPVKAGLVDTPGGYPWSSYLDYTASVPNNTLVDIEYILDLYSPHPQRARSKFKEFTAQPSEEEFLDCHEESKLKINSVQEALEDMGSMLQEKGWSLEQIRQEKGRVKGTIRHDMIIYLKKESSLTCREIAEILGISKSIVSKME